MRVTDPDTEVPAAKKELPNPVNSIVIDDLESAVKAEVFIERLQSHNGTSDKKIRINGNDWLAIPEADNLPGNPVYYQTMIYPTVEIPLQQLIEGKNKFEFTCSIDYGWGQFIVYGITFRIYYAVSKSHPTGEVTFPVSGSSIGENPEIHAVASNDTEIKQVDFIGLYEDFNYEGDNIWRQWHYTYSFGSIRHHLGTATQEPFTITWDTGWVPDQDQPLSIMARIVDETNMCYLTPAVENIHFARSGKSVKLYKPYNVPKGWVSRTGVTRSCYCDIIDDLNKAFDAKMTLSTWNGFHTDAIGINNNKVVDKVGRNHDLSYDDIDVPLEFIQTGSNKLYTYSRTNTHGIEVNWPGIVLKIRYDLPSSVDENVLNQVIDDNEPDSYHLSNYPNPFNSSTSITFTIPESSQEFVSLKVYDLRGALVKTLVNQVTDPGFCSVVWDGTDVAGNKVSSGMYIYRLLAGEFAETKKMLFLK